MKPKRLDTFAIFLFFAGAVIAVIIAGIVGVSKLIAVLVFGIPVVLLGIWLIISPRLWPGVGDWIGYLSESKNELRGEDTKRWNFNSPQQIGQSFTLNITKHKGKARLIRQVTFLQGKGHQWDCPSEYEMIIQGRNVILRTFNGRAGEPWNGERYKGIDEEFEPLLVEDIIVSITKPSEHPQAECWATNDIRLIEVRIPWLPKWRWLSRLREWEIK